MHNLCLLFSCTRLSKAIESLQHFTLAADPSFRHFQLDVSKELKLLTELNFIQGEKGIMREMGRKEKGREGLEMIRSMIRKDGSEEDGFFTSLIK